MPTPELIETILERIEQGESMREIAHSIGVNVSTVSRWLDSDPQTEQQSARAMSRSAEAWLDRGLQAVQDAMPRASGIDSSAARAYAQECARRAAIRNPQYREQQAVTHTGAINVAVIERRIIRAIPLAERVDGPQDGPQPPHLGKPESDAK